MNGKDETIRVPSAPKPSIVLASLRLSVHGVFVVAHRLAYVVSSLLLLSRGVECLNRDAYSTATRVSVCLKKSTTQAKMR